MDTLGIASVAAITVICYLLGLVVKAFPTAHKFIPAICGVMGAALGLAWYFLGFTGFPANEPFTAAAVGIVSGLAATGADQIGKQFISSNKTDE